MNSTGDTRSRGSAKIDIREDLPPVIRPDETTEAAVVMSREAWRATTRR